jgi:hypothetical protein
MWLADMGMEPEEKYKYGWFYIYMASVNILVNALFMGKNVFMKSIPEVYRNYNNRKNLRVQTKNIDKWIDMKIKRGEQIKHPVFKRLIVEIAILTRLKIQDKAKYDEMLENYEK